MSRAVRTLFVSIFLMAIAVPTVSAQQGQDPGTPPVPQKLDKEAKRKMKRTLKEFGQRLPAMAVGGRDLHHLSGRAQRFPSTGHQRRARTIIEQFWLRRSSNPDLPEKRF